MTQLCQLAGTWGGDHPPPAALCEPKIDGWRAVYLRGLDGVPRLYTRGGGAIPGTCHIDHRLAAMERAAGEPMVFDGEFQVGGTLKATKHWCETGYKHGGEAGTLFLFDCLSEAEWRAGGSDTPLQDRKARLEALWHAAEAEIANEWDWRPGSYGKDADSKPVLIVPHRHVFEAKDVATLAQDAWDVGGEGLMLKAIDSPYQRNRSKAWLKVGRPWQKKLDWKEAA